MKPGKFIKTYIVIDYTYICSFLLFTTDHVRSDQQTTSVPVPHSVLSTYFSHLPCEPNGLSSARGK